MLSSLRCKRCGKPVSDAYAKWSYCADCGKQKQRLDNMDIFFRALTIFFIAPILGAAVLALAKISSPLTLYYIIGYFIILTFASIAFFSINRLHIKKFDTNASKC